MRIIARRTLKQFVEARAKHRDHAALTTALDGWFREVGKADWKATADVKQDYATASIISADRIVFNIRSNRYRLVIAVDFQKSIVFIKWIGTHADHGRIDVRTVPHVH
jgi:mRNA interferase HigB